MKMWQQQGVMAAAWRNGNIESQAKMALNKSMAKYQWHGMAQRNKSCGESGEMKWRIV
jgi:aminoglycoside phosphotransferase family enzyme